MPYTCIKSLVHARYTAIPKPIKNVIEPSKPKKCIGRLLNFEMKLMVTRSR